MHVMSPCTNAVNLNVLGYVSSPFIYYCTFMIISSDLDIQSITTSFGLNVTQSSLSGAPTRKQRHLSLLHKTQMLEAYKMFYFAPFVQSKAHTNLNYEELYEMDDGEAHVIHRVRLQPQLRIEKSNISFQLQDLLKRPLV